MLVALILVPFWLFINFLITLLPTLEAIPSGWSAITNIIGYGTAIIGKEFIVMVIGNIIFWLSAQMSWAVIEWVYKKVPGVS